MGFQAEKENERIWRMRIYLASTAPGTEARDKAPEIMCGLIKYRLLSYWHIKINELFCAVVFDAIKKVKR